MVVDLLPQSPSPVPKVSGHSLSHSRTRGRHSLSFCVTAWWFLVVGYSSESHRRPPPSVPPPFPLKFWRTELLPWEMKRLARGKGPDLWRCSSSYTAHAYGPSPSAENRGQNVGPLLPDNRTHFSRASEPTRVPMTLHCPSPPTLQTSHRRENEHNIVCFLHFPLQGCI